LKDDYASIMLERLGLDDIGWLEKITLDTVRQGLTTGQVQKGFGMGSNLLGGQIPTEFGRWARQDWVGLEDNFLTGSIPSQFWMLTELRRLSLGMNPLSGSIPTELGLFSLLESLNLCNMLLSGTIHCA